MQLSKSLTLVFLLLSQPGLCDDKPEWVKNFGKCAQYPEWSHLTGFGMAKVVDTDELADAMTLAVDNARANLVQKIHVTINNISTTRTEELDTEYSEYYSNSTQSVSNLDIKGLNVDRYYDDAKEMYFALAVVERAPLIAVKNQKADELTTTIRQSLAAAKRFE